MSFINRLLQTVETQLTSAIGLQVKVSDSDTFRPGDVSIEDITLQSSDLKKQFPLMDHAKIIDIYESVMSPVIFADINIADAIGLKQSFPILGGEYIVIKFKTPGASKSTTYKLIVQSVVNMTPHPSNKMVSYTLKCVSAEVLRNATRLVNRTVDGSLDDAIEAILQDDLGTTKKFKCDKTQGIEKHTITKLNPFMAIDYLRRRSISSKYPSSSFTFFEHKDGYQLTTMEQLIEDGKKKIEQSTNKFFYDTMRNADVSNENWRDIIAYNYVSTNDIVAQAQVGGFNNVVKTFDIITGSYKEYKYDDSKGADQFVSSDQSSRLTTPSRDIKNLSATPAKTKVMVINSSISDEKLGEKLVNSKSFAQKLAQNILQIQIYGDSSLTVGTVIQCTLPSATAMDNDTGVSELNSGNYLITKLRHTIVNGDKPQHTISTELIKTGLLK